MEGWDHLDDETGQILATFFENVKQGICPHCGDRYSRQQKQGRSTYVYPCGCRLWQGSPMTQQEDGTWE